MSRLGDWALMIAGVVLLAWWLWRRFDRWLHEPPGYRLRQLVRHGGHLEPDEWTALLAERGYEAVSGKHRIPLGVTVDDGWPQTTRLYFDYVAVKNGKYYLVKLERPRQPIDWTPSGLRERLLPFALLFPDSEGIVVISVADRSLRTVRFQVEDEDK